MMRSDTAESCLQNRRETEAAQFGTFREVLESFDPTDQLLRQGAESAAVVRSVHCGVCAIKPCSKLHLSTHRKGIINRDNPPFLKIRQFMSHSLPLRYHTSHHKSPRHIPLVCSRLERLHRFGDFFSRHPFPLFQCFTIQSGRFADCIIQHPRYTPVNLSILILVDVTVLVG